MAGLDEELIAGMDGIFKATRKMGSKHTDLELRALIVTTNLRGFAGALLELDDKIPPNTIPLDLKRMALGLLGTADWLKGDLEP